MALLDTVRPFWPLIFTFVLPRAINFYRALKTAYRTRPPPRPLPPQTSNALNVLFVSICIFLYLSIPSRTPGQDNIFATTGSRLLIPTEALFTRLASHRPQGTLTPIDEALREKLLTPATRNLYLRFGPTTLTDCPFCDPSDPTTYLLYHLPTNILLPHLLHFLTIGLSTSSSISNPPQGHPVSRWRFHALLASLVLLGIDIYLTSTSTPIPLLVSNHPNQPSPRGLFWTLATLRPLTLCVFDILLAVVIYADAKGLLLLFSGPNESIDPDVLRRQNQSLLNQATLNLQSSQMKLHAYTVTRNAVVRNPDLKGRDDEYWRAIVAMEGPSDLEGPNRGVGEGGGGNVWDDEGVQAAVARAHGSVDVVRITREADAFVENVTRGL